MKKLILILIVGILAINFLGLVSAEGNFTPIFCNDYEFTCCGGKVDSTQSYPVTDENPWSCPAYAYKCLILSTSNPDEDYYVGSQNCYVEPHWYNDYYRCDGEVLRETEMYPGDKVYFRDTLGDFSGTMEIKIIKPFLGSCGRSGTYGEETACGTPVLGADGCKFNPPGGIIYDSRDLINKQEGLSSYVVGFASCVLSWQGQDRHICGYKEEDCQSDSDCSGYEYGNKECNTRTLKTYGCRTFGSTISSQDILQDEPGDSKDDSKTDSNTFGKRCEITSSQQVQCCGDTDCGTNFFCDKATFTCKENVQCKQDVDCGVSLQCDWTTNILKKPICKSGKCSFEEIKVDCCVDKNCDEGSFCNANRKCEVGQGHDIDVATSNSSVVTGGLSSSKTGSSTGIIILIIFLIIVGGSIGFFIYVKNKKKTSSHKEDKVAYSGKHCTKCGHPLKEGSLFCTKCGNKMK